MAHHFDLTRKGDDGQIPHSSYEFEELVSEEGYVQEMAPNIICDHTGHLGVVVVGSSCSEAEADAAFFRGQGFESQVQIGMFPSHAAWTYTQYL